MTTSPTTCRKRSYFTLKEAKRHLAWIITHSVCREKLPTRAYKCPNCGMYHLTALPNWHEPKKVQAKGKAKPKR